MSFDFNYKFWIATQKDFDDILKRQEVFKKLKPIENKNVSHYLFAELYARYAQLVNKLGYIYHHTFQVQKRDVVKTLVEASTQRLLELKNELKNLELSEFIYIDKTLVEKRLTPDDITVWTPKYFPFWRPINVQEMISGPRKIEYDKEITLDSQETPRKKQLLFKQEEGPETARKNHFVKQEERLEVHIDKMTTSKSVQQEKSKKYNIGIPQEKTLDPTKKKFEDAVRLIQSHERARVKRVYLTNIKYHPEVYKPRIREDPNAVKYEFTHKPSQPMLVPVKRTYFDVNYYVKKKDFQGFRYYSKPIFNIPIHFQMEDDMSEEEDSESEQITESESDIDGKQEEEVTSEDSDQSDEDYESVEKEMEEKYFQNDLNLSAQKIQSFWKGYRDRKWYKSLLERKLEIYGMVTKPKPTTFKAELYMKRMKESEKHRKIKETLDEEFVRFCEDERSRILRVRGPWIMEDISDNIRAWFKEFYDKLGTFHPYPDEVKGGTLLLIKGETMDVFEYSDKLKEKKLTKEQKKKLKEKAKEQRKKLKEKLKKEKLAIKKRRLKFKAAGICDMKDEMERSKSIKIIETTIERYKKEWENIDEKLNRKHEPIKDWITSDYFAEIHQELQFTVDELMRLEYELLQRALAKDNKKKYKAPKKKKPKVKKSKKKKIPKDLTEDRSIESLFYELQDSGIVKKYDKKTFDYFIGDRNHCAYDILKIQMKDAPPFTGEIKDVLMEYVLGMGPLNISKPKAICLVGPKNSGKKMLCDIIATEIDAVVLDISPENVVKYQNDLKYFVHIILKMAKILQPTVLFINDVHRVFWKKVPPEFIDLSPTLLQTQLKKYILKPLKKEDKVFLFATTDAPWTAKKKMKKIFQKILLMPKAEYATSFILRRNLTLEMRGIPRDFNFSALAMVTRDYTTGEIVNNIKQTLNLRRRMELAKRTLEPFEFLENFIGTDHPHFPLTLKDCDKYTKWYRKASKMAKKRAKFMKMQEELLAKQKPKKK